MATNKELVSSLYISVYNRAPEASGLSYWTQELDSGSISFAQLTENFITHPVFLQNYGSLSHLEMVSQFYQNVLGHAGDAEGLQYWASLLDAGSSTGEVLSSFLTASLDADLASMGLSTEDYNLAVVRQNTLQNKVDVSTFYAEELKAYTELLPSTDLGSLAVQNDPNYQQAQQIVAQVTDDRYTVDAVKGYMAQSVFSKVDLGALLSLEIDHDMLGISEAEQDYADNLIESLLMSLWQDKDLLAQFSQAGSVKPSFDFKDYLVSFNQILETVAVKTELDFLFTSLGLGGGLKPVALTELKATNGMLDLGIKVANGLDVHESLNINDLIGLVGNSGVIDDIPFLG